MLGRFAGFVGGPVVTGREQRAEPFDLRAGGRDVPVCVESTKERFDSTRGRDRPPLGIEFVLANRVLARIRALSAVANIRPATDLPNR